RREMHPLHLFKQERNVVNAFCDDAGDSIHPQSLTQSRISLQIWTNRERDVKKVVHLIEQETSKCVSPKTIKRLVKKTAMSGNGSKKLRRKSLIHNNTSGAKH